MADDHNPENFVINQQEGGNLGFKQELYDGYIASDLYHELKGSYINAIDNEADYNLTMHHIYTQIGVRSMPTFFYAILATYSNGQFDEAMVEWDYWAHKFQSPNRRVFRYENGRLMSTTPDAQYESFCSCSHHIENVFFIKHKVSGCVLRFGSTCIAKRSKTTNTDLHDKIVNLCKDMDKIKKSPDGTCRFCDTCNRWTLRPDSLNTKCDGCIRREREELLRQERERLRLEEQERNRQKEIQQQEIRRKQFEADKVLRLEQQRIQDEKRKIQEEERQRLRLEQERIQKEKEEEFKRQQAEAELRRQKAELRRQEFEKRRREEEKRLFEEEEFKRQQSEAEERRNIQLLRDELSQIRDNIDREYKQKLYSY